MPFLDRHATRLPYKRIISLCPGRPFFGRVTQRESEPDWRFSTYARDDKSGYLADSLSAMAFEDNELLFGRDKTARIVAIELGDTGTVRVYRREKDGTTTVDVEPFHPFVWTDGDITDRGLENAQKLAGDLKYNWLVTADSWKELIALRNGLKKAGRNFFALSDPVQHYLTATGRTLFKQLPFEELKRMQLEVLSPSGESDLAEASQNPIASIALFGR